jgi:hypothetical protein
MKTIIGIFADRTDVEDAIEELRDTGFDVKDISIVMKNAGEGKAVADSTGAQVASGAVSGATTGAVLGGIAGLVSAIAIPGLGAFFIGGPIAAALGVTGATAATISGATTGAFAGGLIGGLMGLGLPKEEAEYYEGRVKEGALLIAIPASSLMQQDEIVSILETYDAEDIKVIGQSSKDDSTTAADLGLTKRARSASTRQFATIGVKGGRRVTRRRVREEQ